MRKIRFFLIISLGLLFGGVLYWSFPSTCSAQGSSPPTNINVNGEMEQLNAIIDTNDTVEVGKKLIFDGSRSLNTFPETTLTYAWDLGDGTKAKGKEIVHTYDKFGEYEVKLFVSNGIQDSTATQKIFVYRKTYLLLVDTSQKSKELQSFLEDARNKGVFFIFIAPQDQEKNLSTISTDYFVQSLLTKTEVLKNISTFIIWTDGLTGLNILSSFTQNMKGKETYQLKDTTVVFVTNYDLNLFYRVSGRSFRIINPKQLILIAKDIYGLLYSLITFEEESEWYEHIRKNFSSSFLTRETTEGGVWNIFSNSINMAIEQGVPSDVITFLLLIPLIATIITFLKQVIGLSTSGINTPLIVTLSFLVLGLQTGIIILTVVLLGTIGIKFLIQKIRLLFIPRVAFIVSFVSIILLLLLLIASQMNIFFGLEKNIASSAIFHIFPMIILAMMAEKFASIYIDSGLKKAIVSTTEIVLVAIISYVIVSTQTVQLWMFAYPELVFLFLLLDILLGKFTGLRLLEYIRFRTLFTRSEQEE